MEYNSNEDLGPTEITPGGSGRRGQARWQDTTMMMYSYCRSHTQLHRGCSETKKLSNKRDLIFTHYIK